jgi:hypothetical protein
MDATRPKFLRAFLDEVGKDVDGRGWIAVVPYLFVCSAGFSTAVAYLVPLSFWADERWDVSTAVYAGMLTFNGLVLALGWNAFGRIYDVLLRGDFGKYLMKNNLLGSYILHISYMHVFQIFAGLAAVVGLVSVLIPDVPIGVDRAVLAVSLTLTIYAIKQAFGAVAMMNDLVWQSAFFEINRPPMAQGNVVPLGGER